MDSHTKHTTDNMEPFTRQVADTLGKFNSGKRVFAFELSAVYINDIFLIADKWLIGNVDEKRNDFTEAVIYLAITTGMAMTENPGELDFFRKYPELIEFVRKFEQEQE